ncbi:hypothetical protein M440DRAFT_1216093 [Trichoderma longibrachiatum ATCC 18648]|uniref:Uncharacterized protein n=1 Tax=Trichoderma longibrachiatum ATCC 18648 TaxID=983965 RepID=A0A2T4C7L3_TRILO|nr:hypothetical protein M440DRAFT_1216093 [Trichoderma longibrachiatum ATCC 18648]
MYFLPHLKRCPLAFPMIKPLELQISLLMDRCAEMQSLFCAAWPTFNEHHETRSGLWTIKRQLLDLPESRWD